MGAVAGSGTSTQLILRSERQQELVSIATFKDLLQVRQDEPTLQKKKKNLKPKKKTTTTKTDPPPQPPTPLKPKAPKDGIPQTYTHRYIHLLFFYMVQVHYSYAFIYDIFE